MRTSRASTIGVIAALALPASAAAHHDASRLAVDVAPGGSAAAAAAQDGHPASDAIDGSASTTWCSGDAGARLRVDLGRPRRLTGLGLTLAAAPSPVRLDSSRDGR